MNAISIISIFTPVAIAVIKSWPVAEDKKGTNGIKKYNLKCGLIALVVIGGAFSFWQAANNMRENGRLKKHITTSETLQHETKEELKKSKSLLEVANTDLQVIKTSFGELEKQLKNEGMASGHILSSVNGLSSKLDLLVNKIHTPDNGQVQTAITGSPGGSNILKIPVGHRNAVQIDSKNQIAIPADTVDKRSRLLVNVNGSRVWFENGDKRYFRDAENKSKYLVYGGRSGNEFIFYVQER